VARDPDPDDPALVAAAMSAMERYTGTVPGYRRAHAHGHGFVGHFEATAAAAGLTVAEHLQGDRVAVVVRLSNGAGSPYAPDLQSARHGATLGLGVEFALPSGGRATWAAPNMAAFPAGTPQEFIAVTTAQRRSARGHRSPWRLLGFVIRHRRTLPGLMALVGHPPVRSFAAADFHGLHAYHLVDAEGRRRAFRYHWTSTMADEPTVTREQAALWPPQFLVEEMRWRVARGPVRWELTFELAQDGDPTHDQLLAWPASRARIHAGTLTLTHEHPDQAVVEGMVFDPTNVPAGIECSDDPLLAFRSAVYRASHAARTRETKPISALADVDRREQ
jgi:catalase